jgi:diguanylate cyclase (GGDEF)-like protein
VQASLGAITRAVPRPRIASIRSQILGFAVLAALVPALVTAVISYVQNRRALTGKVTQELVTASAQAGRETDAWLRERIYELRVFASSYVISENLGRHTRSGRLADFLNSVGARFGDYEELQLVDRAGRVIASSMKNATPMKLAGSWANALDVSRGLISEPYWDDRAHRLLVVIGVPVERAGGRPLAALLARTNFTGLSKVLHAVRSQPAGGVYLTTARGQLITDSAGIPADAERQALEPSDADRLVAAKGTILTFRGFGGKDSVGSAHKLARTSWIAIAEMPVASAYAQVTRLRNTTLLVLVTLLVIVGLIAYRMAVLIVRPLDRLTAAASKVSAGDLSVDLPSGGSGEVGYLTSVFNTMVESLRDHRAELERLSNTDSLTGLSNRRQMMDALRAEHERAKRGSGCFAVMMMDVDHFKKFNDEHGHQAGDEVLVRFGSVLRETIRAYDCAARYGGEEFLVMLSGTNEGDAVGIAERICERVRAELFDGGHITASIGVAEYPAHGDTVDAVIGRADEALYQAKRAGRDRVVVSALAAKQKGKRAPA